MPNASVCLSLKTFYFLVDVLAIVVIFSNVCIFRLCRVQWATYKQHCTVLLQTMYKLQSTGHVTAVPQMFAVARLSKMQALSTNTLL